MDAADSAAAVQENTAGTTAATAAATIAENTKTAETVSCLEIKSRESETTSPEIRLLILGSVSPCRESRGWDGAKTDDPLRV